MFHLIDISHHEVVFIELTSQEVLLEDFNDARFEAGLPLVDRIEPAAPIDKTVHPGSLERQQVYMARYQSGMPLWNSGDAFLYGS